MTGPIGAVFKAIVKGVRGAAKGKSFTRYFRTQADMDRALANYARLGAKVEAKAGQKALSTFVKTQVKAGLKAKKAHATAIKKFDEAHAVIAAYKKSGFISSDPRIASRRIRELNKARTVKKNMLKKIREIEEKYVF